MLALLLAAFSPFAAQAQDITVWSATLTVDEDDGFYGCDNLQPTHDNCSSSSVLTNDDITHGGKTYKVEAISWDRSFDNLRFEVRDATDRSAFTDIAIILRSMTLNVGGTGLAFSISTSSTSNSVSWAYNPATDWTDGQTISLSLTRPRPTVSLSVSPNPVTEGEPVTVTVRLSEGYPFGQGTIPVTVTPDTSEKGDHDTGTLDIFFTQGSLNGSYGGGINTYRDPDWENETFTVALGHITTAFAEGDPSSVQVTIRDIDGPTDTGGRPAGGGGGGGGLPPPSSDDEPPPGRDEEPSTSCPREDEEILGSFYEMTDGDNWHEKENWNSAEPLGEWHGVVTDEDGNVVSLRLADNGLSGDMPTTELLCLTELVELAFWDNDGLEGEVPEELVLAVERAALRYLAETLDVNPGWFEDYEDPYEFTDWHEGVTIDDEGRVTGLDLTGERITGEIPENIRELLPRLGDITVTRSSEDGGCALSPEDSSAFGLFLLTLFVFAVLGRTRARRD